MHLPWWGFRRFTPKSLVLVLLGIIYLVIGVGAVVEPHWTPAQQEALFLLSDLAPRPFWGAVSMAAGSCSLLSSLWPTWNDSWGFAALGGLSMWWACAYGLGFATTGSPIGFTGMLTWLAMCILLWAISRLQDPHPRERR